MFSTKTEEPISKIASKRLWAEMFDPSTGARTKRRILERFESDLKRGIDTSEIWYRDIDSARASVRDVPKNAIAAVVMAGGWDEGLIFLETARELGTSISTILIGYSHNNILGKKYFRKGGYMDENSLYIPLAHLKMLQEYMSRPIVLIDDQLASGVTVARIANALRGNLGYTGELLFFGAAYGNNGRYRDIATLEELLKDRVKAQEPQPELRIVTETCEPDNGKISGFINSLRA
ncbi:MAG: hypothetical protein KGH69_04320 [Candidatus Micrarchaeota archaeon]|nr:hypothetical protein [Candidatus Micrarchaeota archaeon]